MALKIVHLCDVHSSKGEDIPAAFAHTITLDGGTYAVDLCGSCDSERFMPLVAFMDAFGMLTDGRVDVRAAVAENLRTMYAEQQQEKTPAVTATSTKTSTRATPRPEMTQPEDEKPAQTRSDALLSVLRASSEGLTGQELAEALGLSVDYLSHYTSELRKSGAVDFLAGRWYASEHISTELRDKLYRAREIVAQRNSIPRVCPVDAESFTNANAWDDHVMSAHGVKPVELLGLTCPICGDDFGRAQLLGMHARREHDCLHTPQLFQRADELGDALGILAGIRARFGSAS